ncbi:hypothetical protein BC941DRAFT_425082 [Chlamydoabsidia padenii]|nr:hypothetical protein BC941DRAFT_425082 [Chlamydoabsidia padenii]
MFNPGMNKNDSDQQRSCNGGEAFNANDNFGVDQNQTMGQGVNQGGYDRNMGQSTNQTSTMMNSENNDSFGGSDQFQRQYVASQNDFGSSRDQQQKGDQNKKGGLFGLFR